MIAYLIRRINLLVLTSLMLLALLYAVTLNMPGDTLANLSGQQNLSGEQRQQLTDRYQLDSDIANGFTAFIGVRLSGDLGISQVSQQPVAAELARVAPATIELVAISLIIALALGIPLGILAAGRTGILPKLLSGFTLLGFSLPAFWLGLALLITFGLELDLLPSFGRLNLLYDVPFRTGFMLIDIPLSAEPWRWQALNDAIAHLILPVLVMAALPTTLVIRTVRASMITQMDQQYIRALKARGTPKWRLIVNHAMPNSMPALFRTMALQLGPIASTLIVVETIFNWPGIGSWLMSALHQGDYTTLHSGILVVAIFMIMLSILLELAHAVFNPISYKELHA